MKHYLAALMKPNQSRPESIKAASEIDIDLSHGLDVNIKTLKIIVFTKSIELQFLFY